jgi:hypothetical protein
MNLSIPLEPRLANEGDATEPLEPGRAGDEGGDRNGDCMADNAEFLSIVS